MDKTDAVYDLGEVDLEAPAAKFPPIFDAERPQPGAAPQSRAFVPGRPGSSSRPAPVSGVGPALAGSLSMFVPGLGQIVAGEVAWGLFYASGIAFCAASVWASLGTIDRLVPTLQFLGVPAEALVVTLLVLASTAMLLHLAGVLHAQALAGSGVGTVPHPIVAGIASLLLPGWGQVLTGHRRRAAAFLAGVWLLGGAWILVIPRVQAVLAHAGLSLPGGFRDGWGPVALLSAPVIVWAFAVYDAAAGAALERAKL